MNAWTATPARRRRTARAMPLLLAAAITTGCDNRGMGTVLPALASGDCRAEQSRTILDAALAGVQAEAASPGAFLATMASWQGVPAACRPLIARLQPVAAQCNAAERQLLAPLTRQMTIAAMGGDLPGLLATYDRAGAALSPTCWRAANQHTHPAVVKACSAGELEHLASAAPTVLRGTLLAAATLDLQAAVSLAGQTARLTAELAPACQAAIYQVVQLQAPGRPGMAGAGSPSSVISHGPGRYSVPGLVYCDPASCQPL